MCKYLKLESIKQNALDGITIISENKICQIKEDGTDITKIKLISQKEIKMGVLGGGSRKKWCLFMKLKDCPCNEK